MKALPSLQLDAITYFLKQRLRTDPILLEYTEHGSPDEIVRSSTGYYPVHAGRDDNGEAVIYSSVYPPALAIVPNRVIDTSEGLGIENEFECEFYYFTEIPDDGGVLGERAISPEEMSMRLLLTVWRRLGEYCQTPYLGTLNAKTFDLRQQGKLQGMDINQGTFALLGGRIAQLKATLTYDTISPPYETIDPNIMNVIQIELQTGSESDSDEGPIFSGTTGVLEYE